VKACRCSNNPSLKKKPKERKIGAVVAAKLSEHNVKGAVRVVSSDDTIAPRTQETLQALREKHPGPSTGRSFDDLQFAENPATETDTLLVSQDSIIKAIRSFPNGSAGGPDGLRPQHLKDVVGAANGDAGRKLASSLSTFANHCLKGVLPEEVLTFFYGATLCAFTKKDGGIRPIAVGNTLRRLVGKCAAHAVQDVVLAQVRPAQLGYGVQHGAEATVHAVRQFTAVDTTPRVLLKLDFKNAFNSVRRDVVLKAVKEHVPSLLPLALQSYGSDTSLFFGDDKVLSREGVQQGDPLGPLLFSLGISEMTKCNKHVVSCNLTKLKPHVCHQ
jgi:hypothetical protein